MDDVVKKPKPDRSVGLKALEKRYGKDGSMFKLSMKSEIEVVPTGVATLDAALGVGGLVRGGQYIVYGSPSSGKSLLCYSMMAEIQRRDPEALCCIFDIERSSDPEWLAKLGVDPERVCVFVEPTIEETVNKFRAVMKQNCFDFILVDSLGAVVRAADFEGKDGMGGDASKAQVGGSSGVITRWVSSANSEFAALDKRENAGEAVIKPVVVYINQVRANMDSMYGGQTMSGGYGLRHMAGVILRVSASNAASDRIVGTVGNEKVQVGTRVTVTVEKNKYAPPRHQAGYNIVWDDRSEHPFGIDNDLATLDLAVSKGVVEQRGAWLSFGTEGEEGYVKANGRAAMAQLLRDNDAFRDAVYDATMEAVRGDADER